MSVTAFGESPVPFLDLAPYYTWNGWTTGGSVTVVPIVTADMNGDGLEDVAVHFWQMQSGAPEGGWGQVVTGDVPNRLLIFLAQADGTYRDGTAELFGTTAPVVLPGGSRKVDLGDLNNDGRVDWVYALNREDGRDTNNLDLIESRSAVILSRPGGGYAVVPIGEPDWYHAARIFESGGSLHVTVQGFSNPNKGFVSSVDEGYFVATNEDYTLDGSGTAFQSVGEIPASAGTFLVLPPSEPGGVATRVFTTVSAPGNLHYPSLVERDSQGDWQIVSTMVPFDYESVPFVGWNGQVGNVPVAEINGVKLVQIGFPETALLQAAPDTDPVIVLLLNAASIDAAREDGFYYESDGLRFNKFLFYAIEDGELVEAPITVVGEQTLTNFNHFEVLDLNGDGLDDIVAYPYVYDLRPDVYLNLGNGQLRHLDASVFPSVPKWGSEQFPPGSTKFLDANGDGFLDLLYFASNAQPQFVIPQWLIHLGTGASMADFDTTAIDIADRKGGAVLTTWGGNDSISDVNASASATVIDGGAGIDTMHYSGTKSQYQFGAVSAGQWQVTRVGSVADTLVNVERMEFTDVNVALDLQGHAGQAAKLLGVIVGSAANPDLVGLVMGYLDGGLAFETLMHHALEARLGANPGNSAVVDMVYMNLVGFAPSPAEHDFLLSYLDDGIVTQEQFAVIASEHSLNLTNIDFTGLVASGIEYH